MEKNKFSGNFTASFHIKWKLVVVVVVPDYNRVQVFFSTFYDVANKSKAPI